MAQSPELSIVIPTIGRQNLLAATLQSLLAAGAGSADVEIIIVDNSAQGGLAGHAVGSGEHDDMKLRVIHEPQPGAASARNAGAAAATGAWIAFIDDDLEVAPGWLAGVRAIVASGVVDAYVGRILPHFAEEPPGWLDRKAWGPLGLLDMGDTPLAIDPLAPLCMMAGNFGVRRSYFSRVGGYDTRLQRSEDHEMTIRLLAAGARCQYRPEVCVKSVIVQERMTVSYHCRWHLLHGYYSQLLQQRHPLPARHFLGIPRFMYREAIQLWTPRPRSSDSADGLRRRFARAYYRGYARAFLGLRAPDARLL